MAQLPFTPLDSNHSGKDLILPAELSSQIIFQEGDLIYGKDGKTTSTKGSHDYSHLYEYTDGTAKLLVSHECNDTSSQLGDGGGASLVDLERKDKRWLVKKSTFIDFATVGGTMGNCSGAATNDGRVLSAEEFPAQSNVELYKNGLGFRDTSKFNGLARWQNMGWMVEIDSKSKKATQKLYAMGRFSHEAALIMPDYKTVYLTDDYAPSVFFKFVADTARQFNRGKLYAYKQLKSGAGQWLALPMSIDSLLIARDVALRMGATFFLRMEWMVRDSNLIYITETGYDYFPLHNNKMLFQSKPAHHLGNFISNHQGLNTIDYPYGGVLIFNTITNEIKPLLFGGKGKTYGSKHFSNPDAITIWQNHKSKYLVINEDILAGDRGRVGANTNKKFLVNEIWWLDLSEKNPQVDKLHRFLIAPKGAETTGGVFDKSRESYFLNIQHPSKENQIWNKSSSIVIEGFQAIK